MATQTNPTRRRTRRRKPSTNPTRRRSSARKNPMTRRRTNPASNPRRRRRVRRNPAMSPGMQAVLAFAGQIGGVAAGVYLGDSVAESTEEKWREENPAGNPDDRPALAKHPGIIPAVAAAALGLFGDRITKSPTGQAVIRGAAHGLAAPLMVDGVRKFRADRAAAAAEEENQVPPAGANFPPNANQVQGIKYYRTPALPPAQQVGELRYYAAPRATEFMQATRRPAAGF